MKKLVALAVAGALAAPVYAQSNIQLYGVLDANFQYGDSMGNDFFMINSTSGTGGPRIGVRGEEDLGSGLKAVFLLEQGFNIDTGKSVEGDSSASGNDVFTRQAYAGLKGSFGQLTLGRHEAPGYYIYEFEGIGGSGASALVQINNFLGLTISTREKARWSNSALYSGSYQSVSWSAIYSAGNNEVDVIRPTDGKRIDHSDDDRFGFSVKYASGPLSATAIYHNVKYNALNALGDETQKEWAIGAAYDFGMVKLMGTYQQGRDVLGQKDRDVDVWQIGAIIPVFGTNQLRLSYVHSELDPAHGKSVDPQTFSIAYLHFLSKRTFLYGGYTQTDYDDLTWGRGAQLALVPSNSGYDANKKIEDTNIFFLGIRHMF